MLLLFVFISFFRFLTKLSIFIYRQVILCLVVQEDIRVDQEDVGVEEITIQVGVVEITIQAEVAERTIQVGVAERTIQAEEKHTIVVSLQVHDVVREGHHNAVDIHQHQKGRELMTLTVVKCGTDVSGKSNIYVLCFFNMFSF